MERIEYRDVIEKSDWKRGVWDHEPDKIQWPDEVTELPCLIVRGPTGSWCGYVGVPEGHPLFGLEYGDCPQGAECPQRTEEHSWCDHTPEHVLEVHGGVTFTGKCSEITPERWERWRKSMLARRAEAKTYPKGDAARDLKELGVDLENYDAWAERARARYICHLVPANEPDNVWWFGFDCAHAGDFSPSYGSDLGRPTGWGGVVEYRDIDYVTEQCRALARQLHARS